ncbi:MAG: lysine--tRNA ligase [Candidatus Saccharimonadales bacterium]
MRFNPAEQYTFDQTHSVIEVAHLVAEGEHVPVSVSGRMLGIRNQGSIFFGDMHDTTGKVQIVADADTPDFDNLQQVSVGDWVGVSGQTGTTKRGEPSVFVEDWARLAGTEVNFPSARDGLKDSETIFRQRYLDLAVNPESVERFKARSRIVSLIRNFMEGEGFMEVETPILQPVHGGAHARPFVTHHNALDTEMTLRIAPELYLKRLVVGGLTRVFEIGKDFRNEGMSTRHNPEFTMLEAYAANKDYAYQMRLTEELVRKLALDLHKTDQISYQGENVDLSTPWKRITMDELVSTAVGESVSVDMPLRKLHKLCKERGISFDVADGQGMLLSNLYEALVEGELRGPVFVTDYPTEISPLARDHRSRSGYTERFEGIVAGRELCNGYSELNDAFTQYRRFREQEERAGRGDEEAMRMDYDYIRALQYGLPPTAGLGIGIDRLAMLLTDASSIRDVILFPTLRNDGFTLHYPDK